MGTGALKIRRRRALILLAAPAISGAGPLFTGLRLSPPPGRGFEVVEAGQVRWQVEIPDAAFGPDCRLVLEAEGEAGGVVRCANGTLLGDVAELLIEVRRLQGRWRAAASLTVSTWLHVEFPQVAAAAPPLFEAVLPGNAATSLHQRLFPHRRQWPGATIALDGVGRTRLTLPGAGPLWSGLPALPHWTLLPGSGRQGRYTLLAEARSDAASSLTIPAGSHAGCKVALSVEAPRLLLCRDAEGFSGVLVTGGQALLAGTQRLRLNGGHPSAFAVFGLTDKAVPLARMQAWLPANEHQVVTGRGGVVLKSGSGTDVDIQGDGTRLTHFNVGAELCSAALRLPLAAKSKDFADLGRLEFSGFRLALTLGTLPPARPQGVEPDGILPLDGSLRPAELSLNKARLTARRNRDMLNLVFGFRGVTLEFGVGPAHLRVPDGPGRACPDPHNPPTLRVEFPPQHVEEHAFFRQRLVPPATVPELSEDQRPLARTRILDERKVFYDRQKTDRAKLPPDDPARKRYENFETAYWVALAPKLGSKAGQHPDWWWLGEEFTFSVAARQAAREAMETLVANDPAKHQWIDALQLNLDRETIDELAKRNDPQDASSATRLLEALLARARAQDSGHALLQVAWERQALPNPFYLLAWQDVWKKEPGFQPLPTWFARFWDLLGKPPATPPTAQQRNQLERDIDAIALERAGATAVEARAAGATILVFDMPCSPVRQDYALETLLGWRNWALRVSVRAERFDPRSQAEVVDRLDKLGLTKDITAAKRMEQIRAMLRDAGRPPGTAADGARTSIEIPARLYFSPASDARFRPSAAPPPSGPAALWRATLREQPGRLVTMRAIGSADFEPEAFGGGKPAPGHSLGPSFVDRNKAFRTALDASDRHELVGLSSVHGLPVLPRLVRVQPEKPDGRTELLDPSQIAPPEKWRLTDVADRLQAIYVPKAIPTRLLSLSAMGATLDFDARFTPPAALWKDGRNLFDAFTVERVHGRYVQGRTIVTEVLYRGFLLPFGHRATLVKVSERRFEPARDGDTFLPAVAVLTQRLYIEVSAPEKSFPATGQPFAGRGFPARTVRLLTLRTPDLIDPTTKEGDSTAFKELSNGALSRAGQVGQVFWPRTMRGADGDVRFRLSIDGAADAVTLPLLFVDNRAAHDRPTSRLVQAYYNAIHPPDLRRILQHGGAKRRYAAPRRPGDTTFETTSWTLRLDNLTEEPTLAEPPPPPTEDPAAFAISPAMEGDNQPPLYPRLAQAVIQHGPAARLSGKAQQLLTVTYWSTYLSDDFQTPGEAEARTTGLGGDTFFDVLGPDDARMDFGAGSDKGGGLARPDHPIRSVARIGPAGSHRVPDRTCGANPTIIRGDVANKFDENFFDEKAKLFGLISLRTLVQEAAKQAGRVAPVVNEVLDFACEKLGEIRDGLLPLLQNLQKRTVPLRNIYPDLSAALDASVQSMTAIPASCSALESSEKATEAVAALGRLRDAMVRVAAAPLAPMLDRVRAAVETSKGRLLTVIEAQFRLGLGVEIADLLAAARPWLQPVTVAWQLAEQAKRDAELLKDPKLRQDLQTALDKAFQEAVKHPEPTLREMRHSLANKTAAAIDAVEVPDGTTDARDVAAARDRLCDAVADAINHLPSNSLLEGLYKLALSAGDWRTLAEASKAVHDRIERRLRLDAAAACDRFTKLARAALPPVPPIELACHSTAPACPRDGTGWCTELWKAVCDLASPPPATVTAAFDALLAAMERLMRQLVPVLAGPCDVDAMMRAWQSLPRSWEAVLTGADQVAATLQGEVGRAAAEKLRHLALLVFQRVVPKVTLPPEAAFDDLRAALAAFDGAVTALADATVAIDEQLKAIKAATVLLHGAVQALGEKVVDEIVLPVVVQRVGQVLDPGFDRLRDMLQALYQGVFDARERAAQLLQGAEDAIGDAVARRDRASTVPLACALFINPDGGSCTKGTPDELTRQRDALKQQTGPQPIPSAREAVLANLALWRDGKAAPQLIVVGLDSRLTEAVTAKVVELLNLGDLRRQIEDALEQFKPTTLTSTYDYRLPLATCEPVSGIQFVPEGDGQLTLSAKGSMDLLGKTSPKLEIKAKLAKFEIVLADSIGLRFKPFTYEAGAGRSGKLTAEFDTVSFKAGMAFLAALAAYFTYEEESAPSGGDGKPRRSGPYVQARTRGVGLVAGYRLAIPKFSIGPIGFANIALDAHVMLPFDGDEGYSSLELSARESPFTISYMPYGGSGFSRILADGRGTKEIDVGIEFGGAAVVKYGPLDGLGRAMTGFYVAQVRDPSPNCEGKQLTVSGTHSASFTGTVAGFGVASSFYLVMTLAGGSLIGKATLTFSFSVGPVPLTVAVNVVRDEGGKMGSSASAETASADPGWRPAAMVQNAAWRFDADGRVLPLMPGHASSDVPSLGEDWSRHIQLYDTALVGASSRRHVP